MEKIKTMEEAMRNPDLDEVVQVDKELKTFVVDYVGKELQPETGNVTVEMVIDVLASHFPELVFALAGKLYSWLRASNGRSRSAS